jgi:hypothetical protein
VCEAKARCHVCLTIAGFDNCVCKASISKVPSLSPLCENILFGLQAWPGEKFLRCQPESADLISSFPQPISFLSLRINSVDNRMQQKGGPISLVFFKDPIGSPRKWRSNIRAIVYHGEEGSPRLIFGGVEQPQPRPLNSSISFHHCR